MDVGVACSLPASNIWSVIQFDADTILPSQYHNSANSSHITIRQVLHFLPFRVLPCIPWTTS